MALAAFESPLKQLWASTLVLALFFAVFIASPVGQISDSAFSLVLTDTLLANGTFRQDPHTVCVPGSSEASRPTYDCPINIERVGDGYYYYFPPGSSVLSMPFVSVLKIVGLSPRHSDGTHDVRGEGRLQRVIAALLMGGLAVLFFWTARLLLPTGWSLLATVAGALGTQVFSTASRGLWSHTWGIFLLGCVVYLLLRDLVRDKRTNPELLATLLAWMYFVRPTFVLSIIGIGLFVLVYKRTHVMRFVAAGGVWLAGFVAYSWLNFGTALPSYYRAGRLGSDVFFEALAGNLVSPHRGLLVYVPALWWIGLLLWRYRRALQYRGLVTLSCGVIVAHLLMISSFYHWWGGWSFGARMATDLVPWFVLLLVLGIDASRRTYESTPNSSVSERRLVMGLGVLLIACSLFVNARGAISRETMRGGITFDMVRRDPGVLWDWRHPQFLKGLW